MSEENVAVIRRFVEAWNAGDLDAIDELTDPDVIMRTVGDWPEPGPYIGREAVMRFNERLKDTWDSESLEVKSDFAHAADRVVARYFWHTVGHGPPSNLEVTIVHSVQKGRIRGIDFYWDHDEALEAVGLSE